MGMPTPAGTAPGGPGGPPGIPGGGGIMLELRVSSIFNPSIIDWKIRKKYGVGMVGVCGVAMNAD